MSDELYDPYENEGSGSSGGAPIASWKFSRPGDKFTGVVVPPEPLTAPGKGYKMIPEWFEDENDEKNKGFLVWPVRNNAQKIIRPVTERKFAELWPEDKDEMRRVSRVAVSFMTNYTSSEFLSDSATKRYREDGKDPNAELGRRIIREGPDLPKKFEDALKVAGAKAPTVGQRWTIELVEREENKNGKGQTKRYKITIEPPTAESKAIVQAYIEKAQSGTADAEYSAATGGEEPPF